MSSLLSLPYVCDCGCNYVNGDMFHDYFMSIGREPDEKDIAMFDAAKKVYYAIKDEKEKTLEAERLARVARIRKRKTKYTKRSEYWNKL